ncbi:UNVERIFIED_CONTAM: hypothetical protein HDU68_006590, partial [Siphonaria sp. JEL0065]
MANGTESKAEELERFEQRLAQLREFEKLMDENIELKAQLAAEQQRAADLDAALAVVDSAIANEDARADRIEEIRAGTRPPPFRFPVPSTPLVDFKTAYAFLPDSVLSAAERLTLDKAVEAGNINPLLTVFRDLVNSDEHNGNLLVQAINDNVLEHMDAPTGYSTDQKRRNTQVALAIAILQTIPADQ